MDTTLTAQTSNRYFLVRVSVLLKIGYHSDWDVFDGFAVVGVSVLLKIGYHSDPILFKGAKWESQKKMSQSYLKLDTTLTFFFFMNLVVIEVSVLLKIGYHSDSTFCKSR